MKSTRKNNWELIVQSLVELGGRATAQELTDYFKKRYPENHPGNERRKAVNVVKDLAMLSVNASGRVNYWISQPQCRRSDSGHEKDRIFFAGGGIYELYDPAKHGVWETYKSGNGKLSVRQVMNRHRAENRPEDSSLQRNGGPSDPQTTSMVQVSSFEGAGDGFSSPISTPRVTEDEASPSLPRLHDSDSLDQICRVMDSLARKRPIFHSEADFQHALVWEIGLRRVDVLTAGMTVGEMAFLDGAPRSADVVALDEVGCLVVARDWFLALAGTRPLLKIALQQALLHELSARLRQANVEIGALHRG